MRETEFLAAPLRAIANLSEWIEEDLAEQLPDESRKQMNLIGNAIKSANCPDARVWVSVREVGKYYEFAIAANGSGIAPYYHEKIWSIFQRLEARDKVEGTGIGLCVVKKIVESRGGRVSVESEIGAGETFRFTWPKYSQKRFQS